MLMYHVAGKDPLSGTVSRAPRRGPAFSPARGSYPSEGCRGRKYFSPRRVVKLVKFSQKSFRNSLNRIGSSSLCTTKSWQDVASSSSPRLPPVRRLRRSYLESLFRASSASAFLGLGRRVLTSGTSAIAGNLECGWLLFI